MAVVHGEKRNIAVMLICFWNSEVSSEELDDAETDLKIVVGDDWKRNKMLYYTNVRKEGIQIWP